VLAAVVSVPMKLGGYGSVLLTAGDAITAKGGATGRTLKPAQMLPLASLALGSATAAFMNAHTLTGIFAAKSAGMRFWEVTGMYLIGVLGSRVPSTRSHSSTWYPMYLSDPNK